MATFWHAGGSSFIFFSVFSDREVTDLVSDGYNLREIADLEREITGRDCIYYSVEPLVLHPCCYCRYGLHRAGPITPGHTLAHIWDRYQPWLVTYSEHIRILDELYYCPDESELGSYYCQDCLRWWDQHWREGWEQWTAFCISVAQRQPQHR